MARTSKSSPEVKDRSVRMVLEHLSEHESKWAAITSIAGLRARDVAELDRAGRA